MMTATKEDLSMCKVALHKVNTHINGIGMPSKKGITYASKRMFVMYENFHYKTKFIFEAPEQFLCCKKKVVKLGQISNLEAVCMF